MTDSHYRGRFAPSPTGPLHFGSLVTAVASYLEARSHNGAWLVRIEDLDPLRESPEATQRILESLDAHGLHSDEPVRFQSERHAHYRTLIDQLLHQGLAYRCACSRKQLRENDGRHPEHCREGKAEPGERPFAVRFALHDERSEWHDQLLGPQLQKIHAELDDPVILRKEGFYAYQLAVVADDIDQEISHVVRGSDLLDMTAQQQQIYRSLSTPPPHWMHIPVILNADGQKLSKQNHAPALDDRKAKDNLKQALAALGQDQRLLAGASDIGTLLARAAANWAPERIHLTAR